MSMKILIKVSEGVNKDYFNDLKKVINSIKTKEKIKKEIEFFIEYYNFTRDEGNLILNDPNAFLDNKYGELSKSAKNFNSIIYIPERTLNLKENFLWYSNGGPQQSVMVFSSFLYKHLIEGKLNFGAYILLIYSQYLARFTVKLDKSHGKSRNCLNDFCANQIEILNIFKRKNDVLCKECKNNIKEEKYYNVIKLLVNLIDKNYYQPGKKDIKIKVEPKKIVKEQKSLYLESKKIKTSDEVYYEFEVYVAKKCANIYELYKQLEGKLSDFKSAIDGYSIYEVGGGWRGKIDIPKKDSDKWDQLKKLKDYFKDNQTKDLIRPLFGENNEKYAIYDETSIVLRIVAKEKSEIVRFEESTSKVFREIRSIFEKIKKNENSVFFTVKKLEDVGDI